MRHSKGYFADFPVIEYGGKVARDIMARPKIKDQIMNSPASFYDYVIEDGQRPDQIAYLYYDDPQLVWLIFLANNLSLIHISEPTRPY